jgi:hypothetical protein
MRNLAASLALIGAASISLSLAQQQPPKPRVQSPRNVLRKLVPVDQQGTITYFIADGIERSGYQPGDTELAIWAFEEWERAAKNIKLVRSEDEGQSLIRLYWVPPARGRAGHTHLWRTASQRQASSCRL